jgi:2-C-methyl-D-erythritol 2,4-cyclodiphosphate synthase
MRIGFGYDAHRLKKGNKCILCGIEVPSDFGPDGHSDADVPIHALMDALLGAAALGDIGKFFPDTDEKWRMADSLELLKNTYDIVSRSGYCLENADITIVLETPGLSPYITKMRTKVAGALGVETGKISVKATTEEKMGFTGDGTGISATAVVLLDKRS